MSDFKPYDLGGVLRNVEAIRTMRSNVATDALQREYLGQRMQNDQAQEQRTARTDQHEQTLYGLRALDSELAGIEADPSSLPAARQRLAQAGVPSEILSLPLEQPEVVKHIRAGTSAQLRAYQQSGTNGVPSELQTFRAMTSGLSPEEADRARKVALGIASRAGVARVTNVAGVPTLVMSDESGQPIQVPLTSLAGEASGKAAVAGAEAGAKKESEGLAERALELPAARARLSSTESKFDRMEGQAREILNDANLWKVVGVGKGLAMIPSSAAADLKAKIETLQSQSGFAVLQDMRDNSKTGGALGNVSDFENRMLQANLAALGNLNQSPEAYRRQVEKIVEFSTGSKDRLRMAFKETYPDGAHGAAQSQPATSLPDFSKMTDDQLRSLANGGQ